MRILFVLENYLPHIGGVEIVFKNLCEGLAAKGHNVTVITHHIPGTKRLESIAGVNVVRVACFDSRYIFTFAAIRKTLRYAKDVDVIHTTTFNGAPPAWLAARLRGKPVIITVHETWMGKWRQYTNFSAPKAWAHEALERAVFLPRYDAYACVSHATAKQLMDALPKRKKAVLTIHNGFDPEHWTRAIPKRTTDNIRKRLDMTGKFIILGYGRPGTSKGFPYLVEAFPLIKQHNPNARLLLILSRDKQYAAEIDKLKRRAKELDCEHEIKFLAPQPYSELPVYTHLADCIVVPSITEGFGYTTLESCASGTPVVASNTTSIPEVIWGKHVLVKPKSPKAIADGVWSVMQKRHATTPERRFPWSASIEAYEEQYRLLVKRRKERTVKITKNLKNGRKRPR